MTPRASPQLPESEQLARLTLDAQSAHVAVLDEAGVILLVNTAWRTFAQENSSGDFNLNEGANYLAVCDAASGPDDEGAAAFGDGIRAVLRGDSPKFERDYPCSSPNEIRWFVGTVTRFPDPSVRRVVVVHQNITARKLAETELDESRRRLNLALDSAGMGVWHWDIRRNERYFDLRTCQLLGIDAKKFRGSAEEFFAAVHVDDREKVKAALAATLAQDVPYNTEYRVTWSDGCPHYISARGRLIRDELGTPIRIDGIAWDQSERVIAEAALSRSEERFRQLAEIFPETIFEADPTGRIYYANAHGLDAFKATQADLDRGLNMLDLIVPEDRAKVLSRIEQRLANQLGGFLEYRARRRNGEVFDAMARSTPIREDGRVVGLRGFILDISERKQAEQALLETNRQLEGATLRAIELAAQAEQASAAKGEFLANMSHEIRTPMNGVIGMTGLLLDTELTAEQRRYAEAVRRSGDALLALINDILDFSKMEAGKLTLEALDFDLQSLLDDLGEVTALTAREKRLAFSCVLSPAVPRFLRGDPGRLRQVLANLLSNALKFTHQGRVTVEVTVDRVSADDIVLRFVIRDTGIGIPANKQRLLFDKFTQVDASTTRRFGGTGLGLAISKQLVELMGGAIGLASEVGRGSEFWFTLRLANSAQGRVARPATEIRDAMSPTATEAIGSVRPVDAALPPLHQTSLRVLVTEDNITNQQVALGILRKLGHRGDAVANGREALEALRHIPYDLVLMDVQMPEMDGLEATMAIRSTGGATLNPAIPIVAMTAYSLYGDRERCLAAGMDDYLAKPVSASALARVLEKWRSGASALADDTKRSDATQTTVFAEAQLVERLGGDRRLARAVAQEFLTDMPKRIDAIGVHLAAHEATELVRCAHAVRGAASTVGGEVLVEAALALEQFGELSNWAMMQSTFDDLKRRFVELRWVIETSTLFGGDDGTQSSPQIKDDDRTAAT